MSLESTNYVIDQSVRRDFLNTFQLLTKKQQKIWEYLHWSSNKYRNIFPSHEEIANYVGCCRDTVCQSVKKFQELKWIGIQKRPYRTSLYFIHDDLLSLDLNCKSIFEKHNSVGE